MCSSESAVANSSKAAEKAKPLADENPVAENEAAKGKPALDSTNFVRDDHNRVVLSVLRDADLTRGTGHVACVQSRDQTDAWWMVVRLESNDENVLESKILPDTIYEKERGKFIIWLESDITCTLCFHEKAGCKEIWDKICQIQGKDPDVEDDSVLSTTEALKSQYEKIKAEVNAGQTRINDLVESTCKLEKKLQNSEAQNRQLTNQLHTLEVKNRETLERNGELEQELSNSQTKVRDLETKFDQTDYGQFKMFVEKKSESYKNCEVSRLQDSLEAKNSEIDRLKHLLETKDNGIAGLKHLLEAKNNEIAGLRESIETENIEVTHLKHLIESQNNALTEQRRFSKIAEKLLKKEAAKLSGENEMRKQELSVLQKRFEESEKRNEAEQKRSQNLTYQMKIETDSLREKIQKKNTEAEKLSRENEMRKQELSVLQKRFEESEKLIADMNEEKEEMGDQLVDWDYALGEIAERANLMRKNIKKRQCQESGSDGDSTKKARIDAKNSEQSGPKKAANMASRSFDNLL